MPLESPPSERPVLNTIETALICRDEFSMINGGGGRFQLLPHFNESLNATPMPETVQTES